jgi:NitT/TauT family transport system substrate-binding protein
MNFLNRRLSLTLIFCFAVSCGSRAPSGQSRRTEVRLAAARGSLSFLPVFVAGPAGCFDRQNLAVIIEETESQLKSATALLAGTVDIAASGYLQALGLTIRDRPVRAFLLMQQHSGFVLAVSPRASKPIRRIEDLKGANVGVSDPGGEAQVLLNYILHQHGMRPEDVSVIGLGSPSSQIPALERGKVDVLFATVITTTALQHRNPGLPILFDLKAPASSKALLGVERMPAAILMAQERWLRSNPDTARRVAGAFQCSLAWIQDHPAEEIRERLPAPFHSPDAGADLEAIAAEKQILSRDGRMSPEMHEAAVRISGIPIQPNLAQAYTNEFLKQ